MNFQQLRIIHETVRRNFNLTEVANALFTSQSGVSKHIKDLEDELGLELFIRKGKRLQSEFNKRSYIEKYIPHIGIALQEILDLSNEERDQTVNTLDDVLQKSRKF